MTVKELIKLLKKQDPNAIVGYAHQDNSADEIAGWVETVYDADQEVCEIEGYESIVILRG